MAALRTARLRLRSLDGAQRSEEDVADVAEYRMREEVCRFQSWRPESLEEVRAWLGKMDAQDERVDQPDSWFQFGLELLPTPQEGAEGEGAEGEGAGEEARGKLVGDIGVHFVAEEDGAQAEIGVTLHPEWQGKGLATEACTEVVRWLFEDLRKHRVYASVDPRNAASVALFEQRLQFRKEAHHVESLWLHDEWVDDVIFAKLAREWAT